jgi:predicted transcriptional regulator
LTGIRNKRSRIELYYHILKTCNDTKVHTRSFLNSKLSISFAQVNEYILNLNDLGLLEIDHCNKSVRTTLKGKEFIKKFDYLTNQVKNND